MWRSPCAKVVTVRHRPYGPDVPASKARDTILVTSAYLTAAVAAGVAIVLMPSAHPLLLVAVADLVATLVVFAFSRATDNCSVYDAYWSVAPLAFALVFFGLVGEQGVVARQVIALALTALWALRLTWNWYRGWSGLHHEDWRYVDLRHRTGRAFWVVSLAGIHLFPTLLTFAGGLAHLPVARGPSPLGWLDAFAAAVTLSGIVFEGVADRQLRLFRLASPPAGAVLDRGLWSISRNPNYLGEMLFWWGLWLFGVAAEPGAWWWSVAGPASITLLFMFVSIPMKERRMASKPAFQAYRDRVPRLLPRLPRLGTPAS